jgi:hypothetical protein
MEYEYGFSIRSFVIVNIVFWFVLFSIIILLIYYENKEYEFLCESKNLDYYRHDCGLFCANNYCIDENLNYVYEIIKIIGDNKLKELYESKN